MTDFESFGLTAGIWSGQLRRAEAPARIILTHAATPVAEARIQAEGPGLWRVEVAIPQRSLSDGVQTYLLLADDGPGQAEGDVPPPGSERLATLSLVAGDPLQADLRAEIDLMRSELELLKRELRRLARDWGGAGTA